MTELVRVEFCCILAMSNIFHHLYLLGEYILNSYLLRNTWQDGMQYKIVVLIHLSHIVYYYDIVKVAI